MKLSNAGGLSNCAHGKIKETKVFREAGELAFATYLQSRWAAVETDHHDSVLRRNDTVEHRCVVVQRE